MFDVDLGIVGGGQLARMTVERAAKLGLSTRVLDPSPDCPAASVATDHMRARFDDPVGLRALVERSRVTTFDLESPDAAILDRLSRRGHRIVPDPAVLATIQDKLRQREFFASRGFPVPRFVGIDRPDLEDVRRFGYPVVQKARRGGYDGYGVVVLDDDRDAGDLLRVPSILEERIDIVAELAVLVVRSETGDVRCYPVVEMVFDPHRNQIDGVLFPARIDGATAERATNLASRAVERLGGVGVFAVELFVGPDGTLWLNEIAPRPHNSGHVTIEAAVTCQFEQHVRAVFGLPLGDCSIVRPGAMVNLVGPPDGTGPADLRGLEAALDVRGARVHLYGKSEVRPGRKMGHITVLDDDPERALDRARRARAALAIRPRAVA